MEYQYGDYILGEEGEKLASSIFKFNLCLNHRWKNFSLRSRSEIKKYFRLSLYPYDYFLNLLDLSWTGRLKQFYYLLGGEIRRLDSWSDWREGEEAKYFFSFHYPLPFSLRGNFSLGQSFCRFKKLPQENYRQIYFFKKIKYRLTSWLSFYLLYSLNAIGYTKKALGEEKEQPFNQKDKRHSLFFQTKILTASDTVSLEGQLTYNISNSFYHSYSSGAFEIIWVRNFYKIFYRKLTSCLFLRGEKFFKRDDILSPLYSLVFEKEGTGSFFFWRLKYHLSSSLSFIAKYKYFFQQPNKQGILYRKEIYSLGWQKKF